MGTPPVTKGAGITLYSEQIEFIPLKPSWFHKTYFQEYILCGWHNKTWILIPCG